MSDRSKLAIVELMREQYEKRIYTTLLEMEVTASGGKLLLDAGLEVKNIKTGQKFTVQSVQKNGKDVTISLLSAENVSGPITSMNGNTVVSPDRPPQIFSLEEFEKNFEI